MNTTAPPSDLSHLWARARAMFARAADALGSAAGIAALAFAHRRLLARCWIARLEHIVRKLLFAEAARLGPQLPFQALQRATAVRVNRQAVDLDPPRAWSVRFSLALPRKRTHKRRSTPSLAHNCPGPDQGGLRLARRFEALRCVLTNPAPHAKRLARRMHGLVRRWAGAPLRFAAAAARVDWLDRADPNLPIDCYVAALGGAPAFDSS